MWFRMPKDTGAISIEQQQFSAIHTDTDGVGYFQAPDHFAPQILGLKGFESCDRPKGVSKSIANLEPKRDAAMKNLSDQVSSLNATVADLRTAVGSLNAEIRAEKNRNAELMQQMADKVAENAALKERLEELEDPKDTADAIATKSQPTLPTLEATDEDEDDD